MLASAGSASTSRRSANIKLLSTPGRTEGGHRAFGTGHLLRLSFVRRARDLGFTLDEIHALVKLADSQDQPCAEVQKVATHHLADVRAKLAALQTIALDAVRGRLDRLVQTSPSAVSAGSARPA